MENQLTILSESLDKKIEVLNEIQEYNLKQEAAFKSGIAKLEDFDEAVEEKDKLIEKLSRLDDGFESLYQRVAEELKDNRQKYASIIKEMQEKIKVVTELSVSIQAQEARNKKLVEEYFAKEREGIRRGRQNSRAALDYYKSMANPGYVPPQFMDSKN